MPKKKSGFNNKAYQNEYHKAMKTKLISFNPANNDDMTLWEYLKTKENATAYIKDLIRNDMGYHKSVEDMERRVHEDLKEVSPLTFPAQDGYRDEEAIREFLENGNRLLVHRQGNWEVRVDVDARKVLAVDYLLKTNI